MSPEFMEGLTLHRETQPGRTRPQGLARPLQVSWGQDLSLIFGSKHRFVQSGKGLNEGNGNLQE